MPTPIDPKRLPALRTALEAYPEGEKVAQRALAELYGVAPSRFATLIKTRFQDFPEAERHGDKTHWYPARAAVAAMIAYMENSSKAKIAAATRHSKAMGRTVTNAATPGVPTEPTDQMPLSAGDLDRMASAQTKIWRLKREQGLFIPRTEVEDLARTYHSTIVRGIMNIPQRLDPNGELPAKQRAMLTRIARDIALEMHDTMGGLLADADERPGGTAVSRAGTVQHQHGRSARKRTGSISAAA